MWQEGRTYRVDLTGPLSLLTKFGFKNEGRCSPKSPIPARWPGAGAGGQRVGGGGGALKTAYRRVHSSGTLSLL